MSQANSTTYPIRSRRAVLAGIASAALLPPAAAIPTAAPAAVDPIYAAIEAFRRVDLEFMTAEGPDIPDELGDRHSDAYDEVLRVRPATLGGLVALIGWARERAAWLNESGSMLNSEDLLALCATMDEAAKTVVGRQA
jgi:hypothetical protein